MITECEKIHEWLTRVSKEASLLGIIKRQSPAQCLTAIRNNYTILAVMVKVAEGKVRMQGAKPPERIEYGN